MRKMCFLFVFFLLLLPGRQAIADTVSMKQIWFGGEDPVTVRDKHRSHPADFMDLFTPDSPWHRSAKDVTAFKISMQFATTASDADLAAVIHDLQRRDISLALETGMLRNDRGCGKGEGYIPLDALKLAMKRIQKLGGELAYVAMDEVVFFGHEKNWPDQPHQISCQDTVNELVHEVAQNVVLIQGYFPKVKIGAVEPVTSEHGIEMSQLLKSYMMFADLFREATGARLSFFHADIAWRSKNWQSAIAPLKAALQSRGILFGVIIGGNPDYTNDISWTSAGLKELKALSANPATASEHVIIQSWQPLPTNYLPETTPGTSTWMLLQAELLR